MVEVPQDLRKYYHGLCDYVLKIPRYNHRISMSIQKLSKFSLNHLTELSCDIYDEIIRRKDNPSSGHLPPRQDIHQKRNNARFQFGDLSTQRFGEMCHDVIAELDRRYPALRTERSSEKVPEIPPLHRTRTLRSNASANSVSATSPSPSTASVPRLVVPEQPAEPPAQPPTPLKNVKQTEVVPTKSTMVMEDSDTDSQDEYEYYNPDLSDTASAQSASMQSRQNSSASASVVSDSNRALSVGSKGSFGSNARTPFEERLAASSNLGLGPSTGDFHFGVEEQLIDSRSSRLPPTEDLESNLDELNAADDSHVSRESVATLKSPTTEHHPHNFGELDAHGISRKSNSFSESGSVRSYVSNASFNDLQRAPENDLVEYVNTLEDQVKELELLKAQAVEENEQLHNMLADTENERKQMAEKVANLSDQVTPSAKFVPIESHEALKSQVAESQPKLAQLQDELNVLKEKHRALADEHTSLKDAHENLKTQHKELKSTHEELSGTHTGLLAKHDALNDAHESLRATQTDTRALNEDWDMKHNELLLANKNLQESYQDTRNQHDNLQESFRDLQIMHEDLQLKHSDLQEAHEYMKSSHGQLQATYDSMKGEHESLKEAHSTLSQERDANPINVTTLTAEHESLRSRHSDLSSKHSALDNEHRELKGDYKALNEAFNDLQTRYANLQNEHIPQLDSQSRDLDQSSPEYKQLLSEHQTLLADLERQREITEQVRQEAKRFLLEMRQMTESKPSARIRQLEQDLANAEQQASQWKSRYQRSVDESRATRAQHRESMLLQPGSVPEQCYSADGFISSDSVELFQDSITELLYTARNSPDKVLDSLHHAVVSTETLLGEIPSDETKFAKQTRLVIRTGNQLISTVRNLAESGSLFPVAVVAAACSDHSYAACEFMKAAKVRPEELVKYKRKDPKPSKEPVIKQIHGDEFPRPPYSPDVSDDQILAAKARATPRTLNTQSSSLKTDISERQAVAPQRTTAPDSLGITTGEHSSRLSAREVWYDRESAMGHEISQAKEAMGVSKDRIVPKEIVLSKEQVSPREIRVSGRSSVPKEIEIKKDSPAVLSPKKESRLLNGTSQDRHAGNDGEDEFFTPQKYHGSSPTKYIQDTRDSEITSPLRARFEQKSKATPGSTGSGINRNKPDISIDTLKTAQVSEIQPIPQHDLGSHEVSQSAARSVDPVKTEKEPLERSAAAPQTPTIPEPNNYQQTPDKRSERGSPVTPKITRGTSSTHIKPDSTVAELQAYLEEQTSETVDSIRELLSGIKVDAVVSELKPRVDSIVYYVDLMITTTGACMKRTENWLLKDKGSFILQNLDDCCRRMSTLRENLDHFESEETAPRPLKQRLAGVSFDMAKCTKELVKTVEDVSLKNELESIDARLGNTA